MYKNTHTHKNSQAEKHEKKIESRKIRKKKWMKRWRTIKKLQPQITPNKMYEAALVLHLLHLYNKLILTHIQLQLYVYIQTFICSRGMFLCLFPVCSKTWCMTCLVIICSTTTRKIINFSLFSFCWCIFFFLLFASKNMW